MPTKPLACWLPSFTISLSELEKGIAPWVLFKNVQLTSSTGEARKLITGGGAYINDKKIEPNLVLIDKKYLTKINGVFLIKLSAGKKKHVLVKAE